MLSDAWRRRLALARRALGIAGTLLLGGALVVAPVQAFGGDMGVVSAAGIAGIVCLVAMRMLPREREADAGDASVADAAERER